MEDFTQPAWVAAVGTAGGYLVILAVMTVLLFALPFLVFLYL